MNTPDSPSTPAAPAMPRRDFLKTSAAIAATAAIGSAVTSRLTAAERTRSIGANDRIRIGVIGCGDRGTNAHLKAGIYPHLATQNFEVVALADPWRQQREKANTLVTEKNGRAAKLFTNYRDLLAMDGIDAVMIASPDHHHTTHLEAAAKAGKHIYCEKPLATEFDKLVRAVDAVKAAGTVVQIGTQLRSLPGIVGARDLVASGKLGKLMRVEEHRNGVKPYWYNYMEREVSEADVDWKEFVGDRPMRPFNANQLRCWYGYYEFSKGPIPQLGAHFIDMAHFITGAKFPESCMCMGGIYTWKDENKFTAPDQVQGVWHYPEGFMLTSSNNFGNGFGNSRKFYGEKGTLKVDNWNAPTFSPEGASKKDLSIRGDNPVAAVDHPDHFLDWLQCLRTGKTPNASIDAGYQHAVAVLMAQLSFETGKKTVYDQAKREIRTA